MKHGERARLLLLRKRISLVEAPYIVAVELGGGYDDAFSLVFEAVKDGTLQAEVKPVINDWSGAIEDSIDAHTTTIPVSDLLAWLRELASQMPAELPPKLAAVAQFNGCELLPPAPAPAPLNLSGTLTEIRSAPAPSSEYRFSKPNWEHWTKPGTMVYLWEGICLVVDIEPPSGPGGKEILNLDGIKHLPEKFYKAWDVLNRDEVFSKVEEVGTAGRMLHTTNLDRFAYWAIYKGFDVPPQLRELAARSGMAEEKAAGENARQTSPAAETQAQSGSAPTTQEVETSTDLKKMKWQDAARVEADRVYLQAKAAGYTLGKEEVANKVAESFAEKGIEGSRGTLTAPNILREALQGDQWKRPKLHIRATGATGKQ